MCSSAAFLKPGGGGGGEGRAHWPMSDLVTSLQPVSPFPVRLPVAHLLYEVWSPERGHTLVAFLPR